jgi:protein-S-isoprenylcysteine O-methyltransferase Ste14
MAVTPELVNYLEWLVWIVSWLVVAMWSDRTVAQASNQAGYRAVIAAGALLLFGWLRVEFPLWVPGTLVAWTSDVVTAIGFLFTWWARLHLGALWSSQITRKAKHHVVDSGPYGIVRHPIYTGLCVATLATIVLRGTGAAIAGGALMIAGYYTKARMEERFLREQLGPAQYDGYARRVPMLVPFLRHG